MDVLVLDSGEWWLAEELPASPWHILIYRQRGEQRNELHLWLPHFAERRAGDYAFRRFWVAGGERWCIEIPPDPDRLRSVRLERTGRLELRFTRSDGAVLWSSCERTRRLGDLTDRELSALLEAGASGPYHPPQRKLP